MTVVFCFCMMVEVKWHGRDYKDLREVALRDGNVCATLAHYGLLKFMQIPFMKSLHLLLQTLVRFWDIGEKAFLFQGQHIEITLEDVYFITRLPILGVVGDLVLVMSQWETLEELCDQHCYATVYVRGSYILMCDIEELSKRAVGNLLQRILGSTGSHKISGGQL